MTSQSPSTTTPQEESRDVEIRAFRGTRRSSVYRECVVPEPVYRRLLEAGKRLGLPSLTALDSAGPHRLDKKRAGKLAVEVTALHDTVPEPRLDAVFDSMLDVLRWCSRARTDAWLTIARSESPR